MVNRWPNLDQQTLYDYVDRYYSTRADALDSLARQQGLEGKLSPADLVIIKNLPGEVGALITYPDQSANPWLLDYKTALTRLRAIRDRGHWYIRMLNFGRQ